MLETAVLIAIITGATAVIIYVSKLLYSSKCKLIKCGCIEIQRKTSEEIPVNEISVN